MQKSIAKESSHRRMARRVGAAGVALAALVGLSACHEARGGGYIGAPFDGIPGDMFESTANFGFNFQCDAGVKGQITYHDGPLRINGTVENVLIDIDGDPDTPGVEPAETCEQVIEAQAAHFEGSYRSQDTTLPGRGRFNVLVFDQGEPSRLGGEFTGDGFAIELAGAPYGAYTRGGNIEGGNIQVDN